MSRSSTVTVRKQPVVDVTSVTGALQVHGETFTVETNERLEIHDLTGRISDLVHQLGVREGTASVFSLHTTCAIFINESQAALIADIKAFLNRAVPRDASWLHNDPVHSDCDRINADSHVRAMLLGHGLTLPVSGGELVLGQWQRVLMAELDGPRTRAVRLTVMGVA